MNRKHSARLKKIFTGVTGYWIHHLKTLPIGVDLFHDIHIRLKNGLLKVVFDVGANEGQTLKWVKHYQPQAYVISFEPVLKTYERLKKNALPYTNYLTENIALGEVAGKIEITLFDDLSVLNSLKPDLMNHDPKAQKEIIEVKRMDEYCVQHNISQIDLLKIDTEGFELDVLKGAGNMLNDGRIKFIYCEVGFQQINSRNTPFQQIVAFLEEKQYYFYALYQIDSHDWKNGNHLGNALFVHKNSFPN